MLRLNVSATSPSHLIICNAVCAVLLAENKIISVSHNLVEARTDATAHAEMLCLQEASAKLGAALENTDSFAGKHTH
jgi:tRNA(Arg) A34 adenosine deaminase TadA